MPEAPDFTMRCLRLDICRRNAVVCIRLLSKIADPSDQSAPGRCNENADHGNRHIAGLERYNNSVDCNIDAALPAKFYPKLRRFSTHPLRALTLLQETPTYSSSTSWLRSKRRKAQWIIASSDEGRSIAQIQPLNLVGWVSDVVNEAYWGTIMKIGTSRTTACMRVTHSSRFPDLQS